VAELKPVPLPLFVNESADIQAIAPSDVDLAADRLLGTIDAACQSADCFPGRLDAALGAALARIASEPDLIAMLTRLDAPAPVRVLQRSVWDSCATRLRAAAEHSGVQCAGGHNEEPLFVEKFLVAAVWFEVSRALHDDKTDLLPERAGDLRAFILIYYSDPAPIDLPKPRETFSRSAVRSRPGAVPAGSD
jgi:hypothetical protein